MNKIKIQEYHSKNLVQMKFKLTKTHNPSSSKKKLTTPEHSFSKNIPMVVFDPCKYSQLKFDEFSVKVSAFF